MRPTPIRLPDELLMRAAPQFVDGAPDAAIANPAQRAALQAAVRAQLHPNTKVLHVAHRARAAVSKPFFAKPVISTKCLAANDLDEE